jgi:6-phosphogluconolactonase
MKSFTLAIVVCLLAGCLVLGPQASYAEESHGAVFVMTNAASDNQILAYSRQEDGSLQSAGAFSTGGNGSGGTIDPLHSQGSLVLSADHHLLFAVNAGSGTVSAFAVEGASLTLLDVEPTGGSSPTSIAQNGELLYVLNAGGNGSVSGFRVPGNGHLNPIHNSTHGLSGTATTPTAVVLSPNNQFLVVTESATNNIDVFRVYPNGSLSDLVATPSAGAVPFAPLFSNYGTLLVGNASNTVSSYRLAWNQSLSVISNALPTDGKATCWDVVAAHGHVVYTSNAASSNISGFAIGHTGVLTPIDATVVASNPSGSTNLDIAAGSDGRYVYTLNAGTGTIGIFSVQSDGSLLNTGSVEGLPASAGLNGIAAY